MFMPNKARLKFFKERLGIRALKFIIYVLNCILEPPNLGVRENNKYYMIQGENVECV